MDTTEDAGTSLSAEFSSAEPEFSKKRVLRSASWATAQQLVVLGSTALSAVIIARTLSVSDFGIFSYATSLASIGTAVLAAGLSGLAVKMLVVEQHHAGALITALILIREGFAFLAFGVLLAVSTTSGANEVVTASALSLTVMFARAFDATEYWFQARTNSGKTAPIRIGVVLAMLLVRVIAAMAGANLVQFVLLYVAEAFLVSAALLARYLTVGGAPGLGKPEFATPRRLLGQSWILLLSEVARQINTRGSIIVIQIFMSGASVGLYSAAARLSELFYFLPVVFMTATFPRLLSQRKKFGPDSEQYRSELQRSYDQSCWSGIGIAAVVWLVGPPALTMLYGPAYAASGAILQIHVLALPFVFMAAVLSKWILAENQLVAALIRHTLGAVLNIALTITLLPTLGLIGAAYASVAAYLVASYLSCFASKSTRPAGVQMTLALVYPVRLAWGALPQSWKGRSR